MSKNAPPSLDPANLGTLLGMVKEVLKKHDQAIDGMLPAQVISFDRATNRVQVQPLINMVTTLNEQVSRAQIASIPVYQPGGGGFFLNFNLQPGDQGWIKANDRDISLFLQNYKQTRPNTIRVKNFSDAVFYPDSFGKTALASEDATNAVLQNINGTIKIALGTGKIKIIAPTVEIGADSVELTVADKFSVTNSTDELLAAIIEALNAVKTGSTIPGGGPLDGGTQTAIAAAVTKIQSFT